MRSPALVVSLFAAVILACAQVPSTDLEGRVISRIEFEPSGQPIPNAELALLLPFKAGDPLKLADVRAAIQKLYDTGRYSDLSIDGEAGAAPNSVVVRIVTEFRFFVSGVSIDGNADPPAKGQLLNATKLDLGAPFEDNDLKQATENMMERLRANGLYRATITNEVVRTPATEEINIHFHIKSGSRARFDGLDARGDFSRPVPSNRSRHTLAPRIRCHHSSGLAQCHR